uniref:APO domain-containing protein n=1 Tax=Leersia perrieri TaxID=77586 RepID=A0A0D9WYK8_9ORYZ
MPTPSLLPLRAISARAGALATSLPLTRAWRRLVHSGRAQEEAAAAELEVEEFPYAHVPRPGRKWERKPYATPMKKVIRRAKEERRARRENPCRLLDRAPENGLLVAHQVHAARQRLLRGLATLVDASSSTAAFTVPVWRCRFCPEVHVGGAGCGHEIARAMAPGARHPRVSHKEKYDVPRLLAILELCIQAGVDVAHYPTKRRTRPVYSVDGRIVDFEPDDEDEHIPEDTNPPPCPSSSPIEEVAWDTDAGDHIKNKYDPEPN